MSSRTRNAEFTESSRHNDGHSEAPKALPNDGSAERDDYFRTMFELDPTAVYSCDKHGVINSFNHRAAELWGRVPAVGDTDERFCGSHKLFRPDGTFMPHDQCPMADVVAGRVSECRDQEVLIERPDGSRITVIVNIRPLTNRRGEVVGAINCFFDITKRKQAEEALQQSHANLERRVLERTVALRQLSSNLMRVQDDERRKISRELHDSIGQSLSLLKYHLEKLSTSESNEKQAQLFAQLVSSIDKCIIETRTISYLLHPPLLDNLGLASAARWYIEGFTQRTGIQVNLDIPSELQRLPDGLELVLFRVLQEGLTNVHRHSQSQSVIVRFEATEGELSLCLQDHGHGLPSALLKQLNAGTGGGVGLTGMRERLAEVGGRFEIESNGKGTLVRATVPLRQTGSGSN